MLLKSPCLNCKEIGPDRDKDNATCRECDKRIAYANAVEGKTTADYILSPTLGSKKEDLPMPSGPTPPSTPEQKPDSPPGRQRTCPRCGRRMNLDAINFNRHARGPGGYSKICKQCFKAARLGAPAAPAPAPDKTDIPIEPPGPPAAAPMAPCERQVIHIDFSRDPDLHKQFIELCRKEDRPPEFQALHLIRSACSQARAG